MDNFWPAVQSRLPEFANRIVGVTLILVVTWLALRFFIAPVRRLLERSRMDPAVASFLASSARTVLLVMVVMAILQQLGVETASLLTLLGAVGLAVALSLQGSLANFASGLLVLSFRMVRVGDQVEIGDIRGQVVEMLPFHIVLQGGDNQRIIVPNTLLTNGPWRNNSALPSHRIQWTLPLHAGDDLPAVKEVLLKRLAADPRILPEPPPRAYVQDWTDDKRLLVIEAWASNATYAMAQQELLEALGRRLTEFRRGHPESAR